MSVLYHFLLWRIPDYIAIVVLAVVAGIIGAKVRPHCRPFRWDDATIGYPVLPNTFPTYSVAIAVVLVALVYIAGELISRWRRPLRPAFIRREKGGWVRSMLLHLNGWILVQAYAILLAFAFVNITKVYAGRLRPDFLSRLTAEGFSNDGSFDSMAPTGAVCRAAKEGRLSFPSGHAGTIFSGYVPPVIYLMGLTRQLYRGDGYWVLSLCLLPLILPITVSVSRTLDYRHNFDDVLCGSLVGIACGVLAVLFSFTASDTGEWTLRSHPVRARDRADGNDDGDEEENNSGESGDTEVPASPGDHRRRADTKAAAPPTPSVDRTYPTEMAEMSPPARETPPPQSSAYQQQRREMDYDSRCSSVGSSCNVLDKLSAHQAHRHAAAAGRRDREDEVRLQMH